MPEVADAGEDHGQAQAIGGGDHVVVAHRPAGLNDSGGSGLGDGFEPIGKGKESVGGRDASLERQHSFHGAEARRIDAAHLACAHTDGLPVTSIDDGIRLDVFRDRPGEEQGVELLLQGGAAGGDFQVGDGETRAVGVLQQ